MNWLSPFEYEFMLNAFTIATITASLCAVFSCFLVLKGWSLMGDAISHAIFPGVVIAYLINIPLAIGAFIAGFFCSIFAGFIRNNSRLKEDTVLGVVFTGMFAFGLVLFTKVESDQHLNHILFGNLLGIPRGQFQETVILSAIALAITLFFAKDLILFCFDPIQARVVGLNTKFLNYLLLGLLSLAIISSLQAVGVILVIAMLITPGAVGFMLAENFWKMMGISVLTSVCSTLIGTYLSFFLNSSTAATIVLTQTFAFLLALLYTHRRGAIRSN